MKDTMKSLGTDSYLIHGGGKKEGQADLESSAKWLANRFEPGGD